MTEDRTTEDRDQTTKRWIDEAEEALTRTGDALRAAWDQTKEARASALDAAREAATRLGDAIDQGIEAAKKTWDPAREAGTGEGPEEAAQEEE
jgi:ElaB/YqjD/DUF883 family membrane-anchored ribosome-binding protein